MTAFSAYIVADEMTLIISSELFGLKTLLTNIVMDNKIDLRAILREPFYVPETTVAADVLQRFKISDVNLALVIGEYGGLGRHCHAQ